jgi:hypothetical protein
MTNTNDPYAFCRRQRKISECFVVEKSTSLLNTRNRESILTSTSKQALTEKNPNRKTRKKSGTWRKNYQKVSYWLKVRKSTNTNACMQRARCDGCGRGRTTNGSKSSKSRKPTHCRSDSKFGGYRKALQRGRTENATVRKDARWRGRGGSRSELVEISRRGKYQYLVIYIL